MFEVSVDLFLQPGDAVSHLRQRRFVAVGEFLDPLSERLADAIHLAVDGGFQGGEPFVIDDERLDLILAEFRVLVVGELIERGLGFLDCFLAGRLLFEEFEVAGDGLKV